jgi:hypothetical protein
MRVAWSGDQTTTGGDPPQRGPGSGDRSQLGKTRHNRGLVRRPAMRVAWSGDQATTAGDRPHLVVAWSGDQATTGRTRPQRGGPGHNWRPATTGGRTVPFSTFPISQESAPAAAAFARRGISVVGRARPRQAPVEQRRRQAEPGLCARRILDCVAGQSLVR